jgi:hypothetical protein
MGRALLFAGGVLTAACGSPRMPPSTTVAPSGAPSSCLINTDASASGDSGDARAVTAAFDDATDAARARRATLETPVRLDCEGRPSPGLASAWARDTSGRFWTLELREPGASHGVERWTAAALAATWRADPEARAVLRWAGVTSLVPIDARRLVVGFSAPAAELPRLFADRALGVASGDAGPALEPVAPGGDLRDAIDGDPDLIYTYDADLLEYARERPGLTVVPLPWSRTYLLVLSGRDSMLAALVPADTATFRRALARDAVSTDARVPEPPFWWDSRGACARPTAATVPRPRLNAIAYATDDRVARDLAERLVALAGADGLTARGVPADSFAGVLRAGGPRAFIVGVGKHTLVPCRETAGWPPQAAAVALIETRPYAILRHGTPRLAVEWDGVLRPAAAAERTATDR